MDSNFSKIHQRGLELRSWNRLQMTHNFFDHLDPYAFVAPTASVLELIFTDNAVDKANANSLQFISEAYSLSSHNVNYGENYFGETCHCNISSWLENIIGVDGDAFVNHTYCTITSSTLVFCFNAPEQNMIMKKFVDNICVEGNEINCEPFKTNTTNIKNPIFPHKSTEEEDMLTHRNNKVIGIVIVTVFGSILIALLITLFKWMKRKGYCFKIKDFVISSNGTCSSFCDRLCGSNNGLDNTRSISQLSVHEYSERHRLNEPQAQELIQETTIPDTNESNEENVPLEDKTTQTLPEELTKELLESLREKLDDPENYVEAREMIEHLYELIKVEENSNNSPSPNLRKEENIYELPFQNTAPRVGKNKQKMISVGTRAPSLDKLLPLSPYNRQTALAHEYFEPKDFAVHLYAEIANSDKDKKPLTTMPDVVGEQHIPRGPYLRAVREKVGSNTNNSIPLSPLKSPIKNSKEPQNMSTIKSNKSTTSNSSAKMLNRPLPEKPTTFDPGEGTSLRHS